MSMQQQPIDIELAREVVTFLEEYNLFGEHLTSSIAESKINASQLARDLGFTPAAISQWCMGKRLPDLGTVYKIARRLNLSQNQYESLKAAWEDTRSFRDKIPLLNAAISENDLSTTEEIIRFTILQEESQDSFMESG